MSSLNDSTLEYYTDEYLTDEYFTGEPAITDPPILCPEYRTNREYHYATFLTLAAMQDELNPQPGLFVHHGNANVEVL